VKRTPAPRQRTAPAVIDCARFVRRLAALRRRLRGDAAAYVRRGSEIAAELPADLARALDDFRLGGNREGYLLLRGLPAGEERSAEAWLALFGSRLGDIVGYRQEKNGALFHDVAPERVQEYEQSAAGSRAPLALHTERCFHPHLPSHVLLFCLRPDPARRARTEIASIRKMARLLPARHLPTLFRPEFRTGIDYSFGNRATEKANGPVLSVLYGDRADPCLRYDLDLMKGLNPPAQSALGAVKRAATLSRDSVRLAAGDLLIIDNRRAVHGRTAFTPRYDGRDRWLKRAYLVNDLSSITADRSPGSRVIDTRF
jgi:L-asparagine oxygenase